MGSSPSFGYHFEGPIIRTLVFWGSISGSPYFGTLNPKRLSRVDEVQLSSGEALVLYLPVLNRNILYGGYIEIIFPYSLLRTSKILGTSIMCYNGKWNGKSNR